MDQRPRSETLKLLEENTGRPSVTKVQPKLSVPYDEEDVHRISASCTANRGLLAGIYTGYIEYPRGEGSPFKEQVLKREKKNDG